MAILKRSLAEDDVDRHNHTWAVLFILLLSLVTWLLPLSPHLQTQTDNKQAMDVMAPTMSSSPVGLPRYHAICWCPVDFTNQMVMYANSMCAGAFNNAIRGVNKTASNLPADVYTLALDERIPRSADDRNLEIDIMKPKTTSRPHNKKVVIVENAEKESKADQERRFTHVTVPSVLFILAVCLKIPHLFWRLLTSVVGGVNVDQTLAAAGAGAALDRDSRRQLHSDLATAVTRCIRGCPCAASVLYILFKILMVLAAAIGLGVVHMTLLPEARNLRTDVHQANVGGDKLNTYTNSIIGGSESVDTEADMPYLDHYVMCDLSLRNIQNVRRFTLQCLVTPESSQSSQREMPREEEATIEQGPSYPTSQTPIYELYETLFLIVQTYFLVLLVVNLSSLVVWLLKLMGGPCRSAVSPGESVPLDGVLLLQMARENVGPEVVAAFQRVAWSEGKDQENIALQE